MKYARYLLLCAAALVILGSLHLLPVHGDDWFPISPADLALKDNPAQPGAHAMILYRRSHIDAKRAAQDEDSDEEYFRIKIFTAQGAQEETTQHIFFTREDSDIKDIRARTIQPDGRIINFDGKIFEETIATDTRPYAAKTFSLPEVQPGCIIEYKYRYQFKADISSHVFYLHSQEWIISGRLFTRDASFSIDPYVPRSSFDPTLFFRATGLPQGSLPQRQGNGSFSMEVHNIQGVEDESLMPPRRTLEARVEFFYRDVNQPPNETTEQFWNRNAKKWSGDIDKFLNKKNALEQEVSRTTASGDTPEAKLQKLYARAQQVRDLNYELARSATEKKAEGIKPVENVQDLLSRGYGTGRQINWFFVGLARAAGFEAAEVYVAPRSTDTFRPSGQDTSSLTADVVWVHAGEKEYWLDPAAKFYPFRLLPWFETESSGVRIGKQRAEFVEVPPARSSDATVVRHCDLELSDDGSAHGVIKVDFSGQLAALRRGAHRNEDETGRRKAFQKEIESRLPSGSTFELGTLANWDDSSQPLQIEGKVTIPAFGSPVGRRITVPVALFSTSYAQSFAAQRRVNPVYFDFPEEEADELKVRAPQGFTIETLPQGKTIKPGEAAAFEIKLSQQGDQLTVNRHLAINSVLFPADSYAPLRSFFNRVKTSDEAQAVFRRTETATKD